MEINKAPKADDEFPKNPVFLPHQIQSSNPRWVNYRGREETPKPASPISNLCIGPIPFLPRPGTTTALVLKFGNLSTAGIPLGIFFICVGGIIQSNASHYDQTSAVNPLRVIAPILWFLGGVSLALACIGITLARITFKKLAKKATAAESFTDSVSGEIDHSAQPGFVYGGRNLAFMHEPDDLPEMQEQGTSHQDTVSLYHEPRLPISRQQDYRVVALTKYLDPEFTPPHRQAQGLSTASQNQDQGLSTISQNQDQGLETISQNQDQGFSTDSQQHGFSTHSQHQDHGFSAHSTHPQHQDHGFSIHSPNQDHGFSVQQTHHSMTHADSSAPPAPY